MCNHKLASSANTVLVLAGNETSLVCSKKLPLIGAERKLGTMICFLKLAGIQAGDYNVSINAKRNHIRL